MAAPFLTPTDAAEIAQLRRQAFATRLALMDPPVSLLLWCPRDDGTVEQVGPKDVVMTFADRLPQERNDPATAVTASSGVFEAEAPWAARVGCRFALTNGGSGVITVVPFAQGGAQRAEFEIEAGRP